MADIVTSPLPCLHPDFTHSAFASLSLSSLRLFFRVPKLVFTENISQLENTDFFTSSATHIHSLDYTFKNLNASENISGLRLKGTYNFALSKVLQCILNFGLAFIFKNVFTLVCSVYCFLATCKSMLEIKLRDSFSYVNLLLSKFVWECNTFLG